VTSQTEAMVSSVFGRSF